MCVTPGGHDGLHVIAVCLTAFNNIYILKSFDKRHCQYIEEIPSTDFLT